MPNDARLAGVDLLLSQRKTRAARDALRPFLDENPNDPSVHLRLARAAVFDENNSQAREHLKTVLAEAPDDAEARFLLAAIESDEKNYATAEALLIELIRENPRDPDYLAFYGRILLLSLHVDKAQRLAEEAIRIAPENQDALVLNALVGIVRGDRNLRDLALRELVTSNPDGEQVLQLLFVSLVHDKRHAEALRVGQELLRIDPGDDKVIEALIELKASTHWSTLPLYPMTKWGWGGSALVWGLAIFVLPRAAKMDPPLNVLVPSFYLLYVLYSWTYSSLLRRWLRKRGF